MQGANEKPKENKMKMEMNETIYERMSTVAAKDVINNTKSTENLSGEELELYQVCYEYWMNNQGLAARAAK